MIGINKNIKVLKNGYENNIRPSKTGSGYDLIAAFIKVVGEKTFASENENKPDLTSYYKRIDYIEYATGVALESDSPFVLHTYPQESIITYNLSLCAPEVTGYGALLSVRFRYLFAPGDLLFINSMEGGIIGKINLDRIYKVGDRVGKLVPASPS